ncbi:MAG: EAL domain-containing protein [Pseudomonadota bacterium]
MSQALKNSNDLYVSLAFAAADVLFELRADGRIEFAVGAAMSLLGRPARALTGTALADLVCPSDHDRLQRALAAMGRCERVRNVILTVNRPEGGTTQVSLSGYGHPDRKGTLMTVMAHASGFMPPEGRHDTPSGLLGRDEFAAKARALLHDPATEDDRYKLTLLELPEMATLRERVGAEAAQSFVTRLGERLRALSVGGDAAGQLSDSKYGVIHAGTVDDSLIETVVAEAAGGRKELAVKPKAATLVLDVTDIPAADAARALAYTLNSFADDDTAGLDIDSLRAQVQPRLSATVKEMKAFRQVIDNGEFEIVFQPIVDLWTNVVHHFEVLVRFGDGTRSPYDTVTFAEDTGLVGDLDMAVLDRAIEIMRSHAGSSDALRFAVNLSGRSLSNAKVIEALRARVKAAADLSKRLLFEITESSAIADLASVNAVVQDIRRQGFEVCLDDFGAGHAAFHYLRALKVDHVKIDGSYVKDCMKSEENVAFIKAMVNLCAELKITTIAEYVEDAQTAALLKVLKVRYGQGWHYGKPLSVPADATDPKAWTSPGTEWRRGLLHFKG